MQPPIYREVQQWSPNCHGRGGVKVRFFILHTQEGNGTAQSLANYLCNPNSGVSYHYCVDNDGNVVDVVDTDLASWSVLDANPKAINLCFAGSRAAWSRQQWLDNMGRAIDIAAYLAVQDCLKYGIPPKVITPGELGRGLPGIADHNAVTVGLGLGSHTDVGPHFPWDVFSAAVARYSNSTLKEAVMSLADEELGKRFPSRSKYRKDNGLVDTLAGFVLNIDARIHEEHVEREALKGVGWAVDLVKREAAKGDEGAKAVLAEIEENK